MISCFVCDERGCNKFIFRFCLKKKSKKYFLYLKRKVRKKKIYVVFDIGYRG